MNAETQAEMDAILEETVFNVRLSGATGWCTDEGGEHSPAVFEYSRLDALDLARNPSGNSPAERALRDFANSRDSKKQKMVADAFADMPPESLIRRGLVRIEFDLTEQQFGKAEFFARRAIGAAQIRAETVMALDDAEREWMHREAEREVSKECGRPVTRKDPNPARREAVRKAYRKRCRKDW